MKKWVIEVEGKPYVTELVQAFTLVNKLKVKIGNSSFMIEFDSKESYMDAKEGIRSAVYITNKAGNQYKFGFAVFKIPGKIIG